jgi:predicted nucleic acid-binding protein
VIAVDTSVAVAAFASWHERHDVARRIVDRDVRLVGHCAVETFSVLTRLPPPHRADSRVVRDWLARRFAARFLVLSARAHRRFVSGLPEHGVSGGAAYDALVAATARAAGVALATLDRRARVVYERYGLEIVDG